jgi:hypothetical protein
VVVVDLGVELVGVVVVVLVFSKNVVKTSSKGWM